MTYRCRCGFETNDLYAWTYHIFAVPTPHLRMRIHGRVVWTPFVSGI